MNKNRLALIVSIISVIVIVSSIGLYVSSDQKEPKREILSVVNMLEDFREGYCDNPDLGEPIDTELFMIPDKYDVAVIAIWLIWDDDHYDTDSQDLFDTFTLSIVTVNESGIDSNNEGELILGIGLGNINMNAQSMNDIIIDDFIPLGNSCEVTITISGCGSYPLIRPNGFLRQDDPGNDWFFEIQVLVVEYIEE